MPSPKPTHMTPGYLILETFSKYGQMKPAQAIELHGDFGLPDHRVKAEYTKLYNKALLADFYEGSIITALGERFLFMNSPERNKPKDIVPPRQQLPFKPLKASNIPSVHGKRPEAEFWRNLKSKML